MEKIVTRFLRILKIPISRNYIHKIIQSHPNYPSLLSIVDSLERLGIPNVATRIKKEELGNASFPYLLPLRAAKVPLLLVKNEQDLKIQDEQLVYWDGVILKVDSTKFISDPDNNTAIEQERVFRIMLRLLLVVVGGSLLFPFANNFHWDTAVCLNPL